MRIEYDHLIRTIIERLAKSNKSKLLPKCGFGIAWKGFADASGKREVLGGQG